ncbi:MAG TPA: hypothetical protein VK083_05625 [Nocardia sp.]|uniref:hypothetical protein n=1 Tax=Nocardia TaxID=1817 RepID=UPI00245737A9|nr:MULTISPECIES: hypothetical protein [Nocardia]HLS76249.1 hypothetical protein [Nocardia sp.]
MTGHSTTRRAVAAAAITLATLTANATAAAEPLRLEPLTDTGQAESVGHTGTHSGSGNSGSIDTRGSYEGNALLGSAGLALIIDHPAELASLLATVVVCNIISLSGDPYICMTGGGGPVR